MISVISFIVWWAKKIDFQPLIDRILTRLSISQSMCFVCEASDTGLVNSFRTFIIFYLAYLLVPKIVIDSMDHIRQGCLQKGISFLQGDSCLVACKLFVRSNKQGGFGVLNLRVYNHGLIAKFLHKVYNRVVAQCVSFSEMEQCGFFRGNISFGVSDASSRRVFLLVE